ncbi:MAG: family 78 glycoside hydrolase catalytic domain [Pontiellaceae bacterium]|nr:family 78 glycoside hydrolase catalytic domain [Pontiellaceae bacterium]MBN2784665.1 family 78 glycoside hydrolase catalytic domain [Pontiellaceae bacterium]
MKRQQIFFPVSAAVALLVLPACTAQQAVSPDGQMVEFLRGECIAGLIDPVPEFSWVVHSKEKNAMQAAYQVRVASSRNLLESGKADVWDSGRVESDQSVNVSYGGAALQPRQTVYWKVKTWTNQGEESNWSAVQEFTAAEPDSGFTASRLPLEQTEIAPARIIRLSDSRYLVDFGKVAFGYLRLNLLGRANDDVVTIHFAEKGNDKGIDTNPGGTIRYYKVSQALNKGENKIDVHPPVDGRNTGRDAIPIPANIGVITPFRYVEIEDCPVTLRDNMIRQVAVHYPFDETAASLSSENDLLNQVWELCKYSMKATSFCGVYVDGDRERIPYEADAYINQLSHYAVDREYSIARYSHEYLLRHSTWPTEWKQHSVMLAWADWMYTGDTESLEKNYDTLKQHKTLEWRAREDGLLKTDGMANRNDIVDWPEGERDSYDRREVNTVINSFYYLNLCQMADMADALSRTDEAQEYRDKAAQVKVRFNEVLFDAQKGIYVDGEGSNHSALHANMLPLAAGLVPKEHIDSVADFVISRGMACSVYGAQYLLEGLYRAGRPQAALDLMTSEDKRSWMNMIRCGSTITMEAWDNQFKPNQDWNHAWGAAPGNIVARYLLGVRPLEPGFAKVLIQPQPASLGDVRGTVPTIRGPVTVIIKNAGGKFMLGVEIPANMRAKVGIPCRSEATVKLLLDGQPVDALAEGGYLFLDNIGSGKHMITAQ